MADEGNTAPSFEEVARSGEAIYNEKYRAELEKSCGGKFVAISVRSGEASVADTAEDALRLGLEREPEGFFHLVRVGHEAAFEAGWYMSCAR